MFSTFWTMEIRHWVELDPVMMLLVWAIGLLNEILFPLFEKYSKNQE